jgi:GTP1/Obg family GTP-binding protein
MSMAESISRNKRLKLLKDKKVFWSKKIVIDKIKKTAMIDSLKDFNKQKMSMMTCIQPLKKVLQCFREATEVVKEV